MALKRVNYFTHQFLREQDFKDEQAYHLEAHRRHQRLYHSPGVLEGLEVSQAGETEIVVEPGVAVDAQGREVVLAEKVTRSMTSFNHDSEAYISISYIEELKDEDHVSAGGVEGHVRVTELSEVHAQRHDHVDTDAIVLARVRIGPRGHVEHVDMSSSVRTIAKRASSSASGWLRMPFRPVRINSFVLPREASTTGAVDSDFSVDEVNAYCGQKGARGSMHIPVPPGASRVSGFRIAGSTRGEVTARLFRTGWNVVEGEGERTKLVEETLIDESFYKDVEVDSALDDSHALAVSIRADNQSEIWLLAVRFE